MAEEIAVPEQVQVSLLTRLAVRHVRAWTGAYLRQLVIVDVCSALAAGWLAFEARFGSADTNDSAYIWLVLALPALVLVALQLTGAYDERLIGVGSDEFRRVLNAGVCLTAVVAVCSFAAKIDLARGYVVIALPAMTTFDLLGRFCLRKRLHRLRAQGSCMRKVVVVGYPDVISELAAVLRRETYHGLSIVGACVVGPDNPTTIEGIPVIGGLHSVGDVVQRVEADTVAVMACREMMGTRLRNLAWALKKTGTDIAARRSPRVHWHKVPGQVRLRPRLRRGGSRAPASGARGHCGGDQDGGPGSRLVPADPGRQGRPAIHPL